MAYLKQYILHKTGLLTFYNYWLFSGLHLYLMKWKNRSQWEEIKNEDLFYTGLLSSLKKSDALIFDIGANYGWTTLTFLKFSSQVIAYEPDSNNLKILRYRFGAKRHLVIEAKAISNNIDGAVFYQNRNSSALNTLSLKWVDALTNGVYREKKIFTSEKYKVETSTLDIEMKKYGKAVFLKVDVEGHEYSVFEGLHSSIPLVVFEANLPEFVDETIDIINQLVKLDQKTTFNYSYRYQIVLRNYISGDEMKALIKDLPYHCVDIVSRSSEYEVYFNVS